MSAIPPRRAPLQIFGGQLTLQQLHLELTVPTDTLEGEWSLFQLEQTQLVSLRDCTITVRNSYGGRFSNLDHVAVFHVVRPRRDDMLDPDTEGSRLLTEIDLQNCVLRGETTVLREGGGSAAVPVAQWPAGHHRTTGQSGWSSQAAGARRTDSVGPGTPDRRHGPGVG